MVKIAVTGGSGNVAPSIINALAATKKHEILILSRTERTEIEKRPGVTWAKTDYSDKTLLTRLLDGVHTVLSFVGGTHDPGSVMQKNLIDAAVDAGVRRFAPSEWSSSSIEELPWYAEKGVIREYLKEINKSEKILEYTLFQPGLFLEFLAPPGSTDITSTQELFIDFPKRRAITLEGRGDLYTLTALKDLANVVVRAIDYSGEWPIVGGVHGINVSSSKILEIGAKINNGNQFQITYLKEEDVRADRIDSPWVPKFEAPGLSAEQNDHFSKVILKGSLLSGVAQSWVVSDDWNRLLPDFKFIDAEEFLINKWAGKA